MLPEQNSPGLPVVGLQVRPPLVAGLLRQIGQRCRKVVGVYVDVTAKGS